MAEQQQKVPALEDGLLPKGKNPASVPAVGGGDTTAVQMPDLTRRAILVMDATDASQRHYDFVNCLDGMTFGFANHPQGKLSDFFGTMKASDPLAYKALISRFVEVFSSSKQAWTAFANKAGLKEGELNASAVSVGFDKLVINGKYESVSGVNDDNCSAAKAGVSFLNDNRNWFLPGAKRALRDPAVVTFQVRYWEKHYLEHAVADSKKLGFTSPDTAAIMLTFARSNLGQVPEVRKAIQSGKPPASLHVAGKDWSWNSPPANLAGAPLEKWRLLLLYQAMCQPDKPTHPIRSRNNKFFQEYLSDEFVLPKMKADGLPADDAANCNPATAKRR